MSYANYNMYQPPPKWIECPRKSIQFINDKFLAFKTPLSPCYDKYVSETNCWKVSWIFDYCRSKNRNMNLWIDLTNTDSFYIKEEIDDEGCKYVKIPCVGYNEIPSREQTRKFIKLCQQYIKDYPTDVIGVHCTYGYNQTGFLICSYFFEVSLHKWSVDKALQEFSISRPPGIYKESYIKELFRRYNDPKDWDNFTNNFFPTPPTPSWSIENKSGEFDSGISECSERVSPDTLIEPPVKRIRPEMNILVPTFMPGIPNVRPVADQHKVISIQKRVQRICSWNKVGFAGCQPVSINYTNLKLLENKKYMVSWKADGTRYMMLINQEQDIFLLDCNNSVFVTNGLAFPDYRNLNKRLNDTLLDGEMVIDIVNGQKCPRYLVYDIIMYNGKDVSKLEFCPGRHNIIMKEIYGARIEAFSKGFAKREYEPFSIRAKSFYELTKTKSLLSEKFAQQLCHKPDGLIFQPSCDPYVSGRYDQVLKWKPESENSVDFKLLIKTETGLGVLPKQVGELYVSGRDQPFSFIRVTKNIKDFHAKIIECKFESGEWVFMRLRTDKSFPNSFDTAVSICETIRNPVTKEMLLNTLDGVKQVNDEWS